MAGTPSRSLRDAAGGITQIGGHKAEKRKAKNPAPVCLTKALSEVAQDFPNVVIEDVATFAKRSIATRRAEADGAGKVKRPLNAFMLYRKAYQDIAKTQCTRNNHQQVSTICGASWKSWEAPNVVAHFKHLASVERQLHEEAFPAYKYDPMQTKRPKDGMEQDTNACQVSDGEPGYRPRRSGRQRPARGASRLRTSLPLDAPDQHHSLPVLHTQPRGSTWLPYQNLPLQDWYTHGSGAATSSQHAAQGTVQDVGDTGVGVSYGCAVSGLHFQPYPPLIDPQLDPSLQSETPGSHYDQFLGVNDTLSDWMSMGDIHNAPVSPMPDLDITGAHSAYLRGSEGDWQVEQLEDGSHFSDWMMQAGNGDQ
ncbi:hypothetical protein NLG97_g426 [Lecanicillium saksenae]|uniref:Uncharacterized protein n=1 Tax=Lecanicillium saksenae TaxID=468837 RepID=A0ACC1R995_9HYPO|nr:hypothetical protein NLG97_g426 [Lecanicillium saksenae]